MKLSPLPISISDLEPKTDRSEGLHVSDVIKHILVHWDKKRFGGEVDEETRKGWLAGFAFEQMLSRGLADIARSRKSALTQLELWDEEGEWWCTLDGFNLVSWRVEEYKSTEMSSKWPLTNHRFWHWLIQIKAYCRVAGTNEAELYALFLRGDYKKVRRELKAWSLEFSDGDLRENHMMLVNAKRDMEHEKEK